MTSVTVTDLCSGPGGFSLGFKQEGYKLIYAIDYNEQACQTYATNIGNHVVLENLFSISPRDIPESDIVLASPPCQPYSLQSSVKDARKGLERGESLLFFLTIDLIKKLIPKIFIIENVLGFMTCKLPNDPTRTTADLIFEYMQKEIPNYTFTYKVLNAYELGCATKRERIFIIGTLKKMDWPVIFPSPIQEKDRKTIWDVIQDCEDKEDWTCSEKVRGWLRINKDFEKPYSRYFKQNFYRLHPDKPGPTITTEISHSRGWFHPYSDRKLNIQEYQCIQSFPSSYKFCGTKTQIGVQLGNVVLPEVSRHIAKTYKPYFNGEL